jgi:hypothetical protein
MTTLVPFNNNEGLEIVIDTNTGESFASISAVARMTDKPSKTIHKYVTGGLKTVTQMTLKKAEINTTTGLKTVTLLNEDQILEVICKYNPSLLMKFARVTLRMYLHQEAGYKHNADKPTELTQRLLNDIYALVCIKCDAKADPDEIMRQVVLYLVELNPKNRTTVRMALVAVINRLEIAPDRSLQHNECINTIIKRLRHVQNQLEGTSGIARQLFPKVEQADPENCHKINPSSVQHLLPNVAVFKPDESMPIQDLNVRDLMIPSRQGNIKQFVPALPSGYKLDVPGLTDVVTIDISADAIPY